MLVALAWRAHAAVRDAISHGVIPAAGAALVHCVHGLESDFAESAGRTAAISGLEEPARVLCRNVDASFHDVRNALRGNVHSGYWQIRSGGMHNLVADWRETSIVQPVGHLSTAFQLATEAAITSLQSCGT